MNRRLRKALPLIIAAVVFVVITVTWVIIDRNSYEIVEFKIPLQPGAMSVVAYFEGISEKAYIESFIVNDLTYPEKTGSNPIFRSNRKITFGTDIEWVFKERLTGLTASSSELKVTNPSEAIITVVLEGVPEDTVKLTDYKVKYELLEI